MPETFSPIIWRNDQNPALNESNLNRLEQGVELLDDRIATLELGVVTPVIVSFATSVTLNATQGTLFRCVASGDLTLDDIVGGVDGQTIVFEVQASGADRALHFTGSTESIPIPVGQWWVGEFRYVASGATWLLDDGSGGGGGSGNDLNILAPQNIPWDSTITPNASTGALFRVTAVGDFLLNNPINGTDGQGIVIEVLATGAQRTVTLGGGQAGPVAIPIGTRWSVTLRYNATDAVWVLEDRSDAGGSGGAVSSVNGQAGVVVLDADDLADGSAKVMMTATERTKLTSVATGATANATDAQLRNRATHTGTQPISSLATTGAASLVTFLRGDGAWATPSAGSSGSPIAARVVYALDPPAGSGLTALAADGTTNDATALQTMLDWIASNWTAGRLVLPAGKTIKCNSAITVPAKVQIYGLEGTSKLNFSALTGTTVAMTFNDLDFTSMVGVTVNGPGKTSTVTGLSVSGKCTFDHCFVDGFGTGVNLAHTDTYFNKFFGGAIGNCTLGLYLDIFTSGAANAGERNVFSGVTFYNSTKGAQLDTQGGGAYFFDCSFDYCGIGFTATSGANEFHGCHFESDNGTSTGLFYCQPQYNSITTFHGCRFILGGDGTLNHIIDPGSGPLNYGFGRVEFSGTKAWSNASGNRMNRELGFINAGTTSTTIVTPFVHKWGPAKIAPAWNDGVSPQSGITLTMAINLSTSTVTVTASSAPTANLPFCIEF